MFKRGLAGLAVGLVLCGVCCDKAAASDWPQLQHDAAHTGYTMNQPEPPYRYLWHRDLEEPMATANQVIVADGKVFVGTGYGNLYALDHLDYSLPSWYISEAPKEQATEQRTTPLQYYNGNVLAQYWILGKREADFTRYIDTTRFLGDLYYIQNLAAGIDSYTATVGK